MYVKQLKADPPKVVTKGDIQASFLEARYLRGGSRRSKVRVPLSVENSGSSQHRNEMFLLQSVRSGTNPSGPDVEPRLVFFDPRNTKPAGDRRRRLPTNRGQYQNPAPRSYVHARVNQPLRKVSNYRPMGRNKLNDGVQSSTRSRVLRYKPHHRYPKRLGRKGEY